MLIGFKKNAAVCAQLKSRMYICVEGYKYSVICVCVILENWDRACLLAQYPSYQPHPSVDPSEGTVQCLHAHRGIGDIKQL